MRRRKFLKYISKITALTLLSITLAGCSQNKQDNIVTGNTTEGYNIRQIMRSAGASTDNYAIKDALYSFPSLSFIENDFSRALQSFFWNLQISSWTAEDNDCDDFAAGAAFYFSYLHHQTKNKVEDTGIAFGEFYYYSNRGGLHAINVALIKTDSGAIKVVFYEPQTYSIVELSKQEIESCIFWRF